MNQKLGPSLVQLSYAEGKREGELRTARAWLRALLEDRFGSVPEALVQRIEATEDLDRLQTAARRVHRIATLDDLPL